MFRRVLSLVLTLTAILPLSVLAYVSPGAPSGFVNDFAGVLTVEQQTNLEQKLQAYEASTTNEIAVAIISSLGGDAIENYSIKLAEEWQIGKEAEDNGVLILVAVEDRQMRIEVGYGLEPYLTDLESNQIINGIMKPSFQAGDFYGGLSEAVVGIEKILSGEQLDVPKTKQNNLSTVKDLLNKFSILVLVFFIQITASILGRSKSWWLGGILGGFFGLWIWWLMGLIFGVMTIIVFIPAGLLFDYLVSKSYHKAKAAGRPWIFMGGGRGGSGGGGFGGFGGGSFGGGGSGGRW